MVRISPQEGDGFEPLVPQREGISLFETTLIHLWSLHLLEKHLPRRTDLEFAFGLLHRRERRTSFGTIDRC